MDRLTRAMSPAAFLISILALVVATSAGTAYAAVKIGTKQLKNNAVTSAKIRDRAITSNDVAASSLATFTRDTNAYRGTILSARVRADGTLGSGVGVVSSSRVGAGNYRVTFSRDILNCSVMGTLNEFLGNDSHLMAAAVSSAQVGVLTKLTFGSGSEAADEPFSVAVLCP